MKVQKSKKLARKVLFLEATPGAENIKISSRLTWLKPYLKRVKKLMPSLEMPERIRSNKPSLKKIMRVWANVHFESKTIVIATHRQQLYRDADNKLKVEKIVPLTKKEILDTLAHELAHLHYPYHNFEHEQFSKIIFHAFGLKQKCPHCQGTGEVLLVQ